MNYRKFELTLVKFFQAILILTILAWTINLPGLFGQLIFGEQFLAVVLGAAIALVFLEPENNLVRKIFNYLLVMVTIASFSYFYINYAFLIDELAYMPINSIIVSSLIILLCLEATRRIVGPFIAIVAIVFIIYALFGHNLPDDFASRPILTNRLVVYLGIDTNAIFGRALDIGVFVIVPFLLMGKFLTLCGGANFFSDISTATMGCSRGGAAKVSLIGSILFGSISGSAVANVAGTGIVTIPLMKNTGFPPRVAAAIEAVASTGGQLMPPVMGASAFLMAEFLEVPYSTVMLAAITPAILYYAALFIYVDLKARELDLKMVELDQIPKVTDVLRRGWFVPIPFIIFLGSIFIFNFQPQNAALLAALILFFTSFMTSYQGEKISIRSFYHAMLDTSSAAVEIIVICAIAGMVIGSLNLSGLAFNLSQHLVLLSGDNLFGLLFMAAIVSIILGMGMPTVGVYVLLSALVAPALIEAGIEPIVSHMFVLYFGMLSMITPPVALASAVAAKLADTTHWKASAASMHVGWVAYIVPFVFVGYPALIMFGTATEFFWAAFLGSSVVLAGTVAMNGYFLQKLSRRSHILLTVAVTITLLGKFFPGEDIISEIAGLTLMYFILGRSFLMSRSVKS